MTLLFLYSLIEPKISPETFCKAFPFHLIFDRNMIIQQAGSAIARLIPETTQKCCLLDILEMVSISKVRYNIKENTGIMVEKAFSSVYYNHYYNCC